MRSLHRTSVVVSVVAALAVILIIVGSTAGGGKRLLANPDAGLTDEQRAAKHAEERTAFEARLAQWTKDLDVSKLNLASLPHAELMLQLSPPATSLTAAVARADRVVIGTVSSIRPSMTGTMITLSVETSIKGNSPGTLEIRQSSTLRPTPDWKGVVIADSPGGPLLLPGTRAELLLMASPDGFLDVQESTGVYLFTSQGVKATGNNPFAASVDGKHEAALVSESRTAASK
jgi:hypothetical protein